MNRPPLEVADIVRCAGQSFIERSHKWINGQASPEVSWVSLSRQLGWMTVTIESYSPDAALRLTAALK